MHARRMYASVRNYAARVHREFPFDIILATWAYPDAVAAARLAREFGVPLVAKVHGSDINELSKLPEVRKQIVDAFNQAFGIISVSAALKYVIVDMGVPEDRVLVQHNAVDGEKFTLRDTAESRKRLGLPADKTLLCFVGRLGYEKGADLLLEAMAILSQQGLDKIELVVVGGGEEAPALQAQARNSGLQDRVRFIGSRPPADIPEWISACDLLCLPSRREGCPNVVLEALASGKPVVACNVGGVSELLDERNGVVTAPESSHALACGIRTAMERTWDQAALRNSVEFLSWNAVADAVFDIMKDAVKSAVANAGEPNTVCQASS
jgi:glycosyltransferase involved in cell wall biosynthesis